MEKSPQRQGYAGALGGTSPQLRSTMLDLSPPELLVVLQQHRLNLALFPRLKNTARDVSLRERTCSRHYCSSGESPTGLDGDGDKAESDSANKAPVRTIIRLNR